MCTKKYYHGFWVKETKISACGQTYRQISKSGKKTKGIGNNNCDYVMDFQCTV